MLHVHADISMSSASLSPKLQDASQSPLRRKIRTRVCECDGRPRLSGAAYLWSNSSNKRKLRGILILSAGPAMNKRNASSTAKPPGACFCKMMRFNQHACWAAPSALQQRAAAARAPAAADSTRAVNLRSFFQYEINITAR